MRNLLLTLQYDGTNYHGYQVQENAITICQVFQDALEEVFGDRHSVIGCSRTDSGVHALDYKISFITKLNVPVQNIPIALNRVLPKDIVVTDIIEVPMDFHARYNALGKTYLYKVHNSETKDPFNPTHAYHYPYKIDADYLNNEIKAFIGTYNFSAFCAGAKESENTTRTITAASVVRSGNMVEIEITGDGFLHNMVRIIVGTILEISSGRIKQGTIPEIIERGERKRAGKTAPAHGLFLKKVYYSNI